MVVNEMRRGQMLDYFRRKRIEHRRLLCPSTPLCASSYLSASLCVFQRLCPSPSPRVLVCFTVAPALTIATTGNYRLETIAASAFLSVPVYASLRLPCLPMPLCISQVLSRSAQGILHIRRSQLCLPVHPCASKHLSLCI